MLLVKCDCYQLWAIALLCYCIAFSRAYQGIAGSRSIAFKVRYYAHHLK